MRGFLSGMAAGLVVAVAGLSAASLLAPQPAGNRPPEVPQVDPPAEAAGDIAATAPGEAPGAVAEAPAVAPVAAPAPPEAAPVPPVADTAPAAVPESGSEAPESGPVPEPLAAAPVTPEPVTETGEADMPGPAPVVPAPELGVAAETAPATPAPVAPPVAAADVTPDLPEAVPELTPVAEAAGAVAPEVDMVADLPLAGAEDPAQPMTEAAPAPAPEIAPDADVPVAEATAPDMAAPAVTAEAEVNVAPAPPAPEGEVENPAPRVLPQVGVAPEAPAEPAAPEAEVAEEAALPGQNGTAAMPGGDAGVRIIRPADETAVADAAAEEVPALVRFGAAWEGAADLPRVGVVLIDDGALAGAVAAVAALPVPVTVAIDSGQPGAAALAEAYRAAGIEVLVIARLPQGAAPTDVAVTYEAVFAMLPEVIGVLDAGEGGLQERSAVTEQAMARLAADGRGAVVPGGGLNMAARAAAEAGVPLVTLSSREIDVDGADSAAVRRAMDQAAFRARQSGSVVLLGHVRAETLSALMLWGASATAEQVAVAPVSVILRESGSP